LTGSKDELGRVIHVVSLVLCTPSQTPLCFSNIDSALSHFGVPPFCPEFLVEDILAQLAGNNWTSAESSIFFEKVLVVLYKA
jgi:hypothetical protein